MPPPRRRSAPTPVEEHVDPELTVMPALGDQYKKQSLPAETISLECGECHSTRTVYVDDASIYDEQMREELFAVHGSYKPPLCGFCKRRRDRQRKAA